MFTRKIVVFVGLICLLTLLANSFFTYPSADDYPYYIRLHKVGYWEFQNWHYFFWGGRYLPNAILGTFKIDGEAIYLYRAIAFLLILLQYLGFVIFSKKFIKKEYFFIANLLFISYLFSLYSISQQFYWLPGSITYGLGVTLCLYIWSLIEKSENKYYFTLILLLIFLVNGTNEATMIFFNGSLLLYFTYLQFHYKKVASRHYVLFLFSFCCLLFSMLAPGNSVRSLSAHNPNTSNFFFAFPRAVKWSFVFLYEKFWIFIPVSIIISNHLNLKFLELNLTKRLKKKFLSLAILFPFVLLIFGSFLSFWATARVSPERMVNILAFFFMLGLVLSLVFIKRNYNFNPIRSQFLYLIVPIVIILVKNEFRENFIDLTCGTSYAFAKKMAERERLIKLTDSKTVILPPVEELPKTIYFKELSSDSKDFFNRYYALYFNKDEVSVRKD